MFQRALQVVGFPPSANMGMHPAKSSLPSRQGYFKGINLMMYLYHNTAIISNCLIWYPTTSATITPIYIFFFKSKRKLLCYLSQLTELDSWKSKKVENKLKFKFKLFLLLPFFFLPSSYSYNKPVECSNQKMFRNGLILSASA